MKLCVRALVLAAVPLSLCAQSPAAWRTSDPATEGLDPAAIERASAYIQNDCPTRHSFVVMKNGKIVAEQYYRGGSAQMMRIGNSLTKSVLSALFGIAISQGKIRSIDQYVSDFFPEYASLFRDRLHGQWRIRHLIGMTTGIAYEDFNTPNYRQNDDWVRGVLSLPVIYTPGEEFSYHSGISHIAAVALSKAVGRPLLDYALDNLFRPIGITNVQWERDPRGYYVGGWGLSMYPRDWARFGQLYLNRGKWEGRQVVPEVWVDLSTSVQHKNLGRTYAPLPNGMWSMSSVGDYGFGWWRKLGRNYVMLAGLGIQGQAIYIVPELDLVMVTMALANGVINRDVEAQCQTLMTTYLLPGVLSRPPEVRSISSSASGADVIAPNDYLSIYGRDLTNRVSTWSAREGKLPLSLAGVKVSVGGRDCAVSYANPAQVNVLVPPDIPAGDVEVSIANEAGSASGNIRVQPVAPAVLTMGGGRIAAVVNGCVLALPRSIPGAVTCAARPGDVVEVYATGLGGTAKPYVFPTLVDDPIWMDPQTCLRATIDGKSASVLAAALRYAGVWQVNIEVPADVSSGEVSLALEANGVPSQPGLTIAVMR